MGFRLAIAGNPRSSSKWATCARLPSSNANLPVPVLGAGGGGALGAKNSYHFWGEAGGAPGTASQKEAKSKPRSRKRSHKPQETQAMVDA